MTLNALAGPQFADPRVALWSRPFLWPEDNKLQLFAARAIDELAKALGIAGWSPQCPTTTLTWELPENLSVYTDPREISRGLSLLERDEGNPRYLTGTGLLAMAARNVEHPFPSATEWARAVQLSKAESDLAWNQFLPFIEVTNRLVAALRDGAIVSFVRPVKGGEPRLIPWHAWNGERLWWRFETCRYNEDAPFDRTGVDGGGWLYIDRNSICSFLGGTASTPVPADVNSAIRAEVSRQARRAGRPPHKMLHLIVAEFVRLVHEQGIPDETSDSEVARKILATLSAEGKDDLPELDTVRKHVAIWRSRAGRLA